MKTKIIFAATLLICNNYTLPSNKQFDEFETLIEHQAQRIVIDKFKNDPLKALLLKKNTLLQLQTDKKKLYESLYSIAQNEAIKETFDEYYTNFNTLTKQQRFEKCATLQILGMQQSEIHRKFSQKKAHHQKLITLLHQSDAVKITNTNSAKEIQKDLPLTHKAQLNAEIGEVFDRKINDLCQNNAQKKEQQDQVKRLIFIRNLHKRLTGF